MKRSKINRALDHLDDDLISGAAYKGVKKPAWQRFAAIAAALALILTGSVLIANFISMGSASAVVALDVNPSLEIAVNKNDKVISVTPFNDDARRVLGDMKLRGVDLDVAVNAVIGAMLAEGYLSVDQNSILISVDAEDAQKGAALQSLISDKIASILGGKNIEASMITQTYNKEETKENAVSAAVAALVGRIIDAGLTNSNGLPYTYEELCALKVNELKLILESKEVKLEGVGSQGNASDGKYIGKSAALEIAANKAGADTAGIRDAEVELDFDRRTGAMIYEIEFTLGGSEYEFEIDAASGVIIKEDIESEICIDTPPQPVETIISKTEALSAALADAGLRSQDVRDVDCDLHNKNHYTVEFETSDTEYEYKIDAVSGGILHKKTEPKEKSEGTREPGNDTVTPPTESFTRDSAIAAALADAGLTESQVRDLECEFDDGFWEVDFETKTKEYEYKFTASGKLAEREIEEND